MYRRVMHYLFHRVRTSLYTIFFVNISFVGLFFHFPFPFPLFTPFSAAGTAKILMFNLVVALDSATYNWPCENIGSGKYTPTLGIVCPCDLFTVIAKLSRIGNCFRLNWKGNISYGQIVTHHILHHRPPHEVEEYKEVLLWTPG